MTSDDDSNLCSISNYYCALNKVRIVSLIIRERASISLHGKEVDGENYKVTLDSIKRDKREKTCLRGTP